MDQETIKIIFYIIAGGAVLLLLVRLASRPKKCTVCGVLTKDFYRQNKKTIVLCRNHLVERWKQDVKSSTVNMMIIEPDLNQPRGFFGFLYGTPSDLKLWEYPDEAAKKVENIIEGIINQSCSDCNSRATVAFFKKESFIWPFFEKIDTPPIYLCKSCAINRLEPVLMSSQKLLNEGIDSPKNESGVFHLQEF